MNTNTYMRIYLLGLTTSIMLGYTYAAQNASVLEYLTNLRSVDSGQVGFILGEIFYSGGVNNGKIKQDYLELAGTNGATVSDAGIVQLEHSTGSTSQTKAPTSGIIKLMREELVGKIGNKQDQAIGGATSIMTGNLVDSRVLVSDSNGKVAASTVTSTELRYLTGVTSNVQAQLNTKLTTGNVSGTTGYMPKFTATNIIGNSVIFESGSNIGIGTNNPVTFKFNVLGNGGTAGHVANFKSTDSTSYIGLSAITGSNYLSTNSSGDFAIHKPGVGDRMTILGSNGNVGIGESAPSYKLTVNGDVLATGWLRTSGTQGWYSETYGGGWYMNDTNRIRAYNDKNIWTTGILGSHWGLTVGYGGLGSPTGGAIFSGSVGIGTSSPGQKLTVAGTVESTSGGFKFPDGTIQTTASSGGGASAPYIAGSYIILNTNSKIITTTSSTKTKEIRIDKGGTITTSFNLCTSTCTDGTLTVTNKSYGQIYKNNSPAGTARSRTTSGCQEFSEDITVNAGDLIQIYAYGTNNAFCTSNKGVISLFSIKVGNPTVPSITLD